MPGMPLLTVFINPEPLHQPPLFLLRSLPRPPLVSSSLNLQPPREAQTQTTTPCSHPVRRLHRLRQHHPLPMFRPLRKVFPADSKPHTFPLHHTRGTTRFSRLPIWSNMCLSIHHLWRPQCASIDTGHALDFKPPCGNFPSFTTFLQRCVYMFHYFLAQKSR
jgi:hypothetical protein